MANNTKTKEIKQTSGGRTKALVKMRNRNRKGEN
jgi:hypothetical protein